MLDGLYVIRASVLAETLEPEQTVCAYKDLSKAEQAQVRPNTSSLALY
jgi:hypothetical protein